MRTLSVTLPTGVLVLSMLTPALADVPPGGAFTDEGNHCFDTGDRCDPIGKTFPACEYPHAEGCSVTGGYVSRGNESPDLVGYYFSADYCRGELRSFKYVAGVVGAERNWSSDLGGLGSVTSFGVDNKDRLYIMNTSGDLMRLTPSP